MKFSNEGILKFRPSTPIEIYSKTTTYIPGQGNTTIWEKLKSGKYEVFYAEWQTTYGDRAISAEALGVKESATVKTYYNPALVESMKREQTLIVKNLDPEAFADGAPNKNNPNLFELWGGVDNVKEENQFIEFRVRRYEGL